MIRVILITFLVFVFIGCSSPINNGNESSIATSTASISSEVSSTVFVTPTLQETPVTLQDISQACAEMDITNESGLPLKGVTVFDNLSPDLVTTGFLRDLETSSLSALSSPGVFQQFWGISPDRKYILYEYEKTSGEDSDYRLIVTDSEGQIVKEFDNQFPNDPYSANYYNWQNEENIRVVLFSESQQAFKMSPRIYNPFTDEYRILRTDYPEYAGKDLDWDLDWIALSTLHFEGANIVYDPSITRVLYPKNGEIVSLTDVDTGKELASTHLPNWGRLPK